MGNNPSNAPKQSVEVTCKIAETFNKFKDPRDGTIKRDKFQEALSTVDTLGSRKLKDSPLADLIFDLFARQNPLYITDKEFNACARALASENSAQRTETTFQALAGFGQDVVHFETIVDLFEKSWRKACRSVISKRQNRAKAVGGEDYSSLIQSFCEKNIGNVADEVRGSLLKNDSSGKGALDRAEFSQWLIIDRTVKVVVETDTVEIPTSLTHQKVTSAYPATNSF